MNWHAEYLHSHTRQQCLKGLEKNWTSYFKALQDYKKHPSKYNGIPQPPGYKHMERRKNEVIFTNFAIRRKNGYILLSLSKAMQEKFQVENLKVEDTFPLPPTSHIQQIRLHYDHGQQQWLMLMIYQVKVPPVHQDRPNIMAIDLGLDNLATLTFSHNTVSIIICGRKLKDINRYMNHRISHLQSIRMKQTGSKGYKNTSQINRLRKKRHDYITNFLHQASRKVIHLANQHGVGKIVIGDLRGIKQKSPLKTFVQIPIQRLVQMIQYKAVLAGIEVEVQKEAYTSGVSAFDLEPITRTYYNKSRRITRGLFRLENGLLVNADVNGSLNLLRKSYAGIPNLIQLVRDSGCVNHPKRIRVA